MGGVRGGYNSGFRGLQPLLDLQKTMELPTPALPSIFEKKGGRRREGRKEGRGRKKERKGENEPSLDLVASFTTIECFHIDP